MTESEQKELWLMLGEMRSDLKTLVHERRNTNTRLDEHITATDARLKTLEGWKVRVATFTGILGVMVPTVLSVVAHKLGLQ